MASLAAQLEAEPMSLGQALRAVREQRTGLSARGLSLAAGLSESYVGKVEADQCEPSVRAFAKIAIQLGLKPAEAWILVCREAKRS